MDKKSGMFGWVWWQNSSKRHLKIDRSRFFIFLKIKEKKRALKQNPLNKKSRKLLDELCGRQQCKFKIVDDQIIILPLKMLITEMIKFEQKSTKKQRFARNYDFSHCTPLFIFSIFGEFGKTHLKICSNWEIDGTKSSLKSYWVSVKYTQRPLKVNKPWFSVLFTKIEIARNTTENGLQTVPI